MDFREWYMQGLIAVSLALSFGLVALIARVNVLEQHHAPEVTYEVHEAIKRIDAACGGDPCPPPEPSWTPDLWLHGEAFGS